LGFISLGIRRRLGDKEWIVRPSTSTAEARSHGATEKTLRLAIMRTERFSLAFGFLRDSSAPWWENGIA
jgi:hypothetical protein